MTHTGLTSTLLMCIWAGKYKQIIEYIGCMSPEVVCTVGSQKWIGN